MDKMGDGFETGVSEKSSTDNPSSAPGDISKSVQRIQNVAPLDMLRPVIVKLIFERFAGLFPSSVFVDAITFGLLISRLS
jgi:hypothetical protein